MSVRLTPAQRHLENIRAQKAEREAEELAAQKEAQDAANTVVARPLSVFDGPEPETTVHRISPAQRHRAMVLASAVILAAGSTGTAPARPEIGPEATEYDLLRAQLGEHMYQLSQISSVERKIEAKRTMIEAYDTHVLAVLEAANESGKAVQDEVFVTIMIWRIDVGDFGMALEMAEHVLKHGLELPERYKRSAPTLIAEEVAMAGLFATSLDKDFPIDILMRAEALTDAPELNVNDIVRAKLQKALGLQFVRLADKMEDAADGPAGAKRAAYAQALEHLKRALALDANSGTKKARDRLIKLLEKTPESHAPTGA